MKIFIAGDVVPHMDPINTSAVVDEHLFCAMKSFIADSDVAIVNLEAPVIIHEQTPIMKSGPNLYTTKATVEILKRSGFNIVALANNHFFDQGQIGVDNTLNACRDYSIEYVGGGHDSEEARRVLFKEVLGKCLAIINVCEHEFSIAGEGHGGSNPLDLIHMQEDITTARQESDYVLVVVHGGVELYQYPTPRMQRWYRHFVDLGADAVVNHHQHCVVGYEVYKDRPIFYGLGNFLFPKPPIGQKRNSLWNNGYAVMLTLDERVTFEMIPYHQNVDGITLRNQEEFEKEIESLNRPIAKDDLLQQKYDDFIIKSENSIKMQLLPSFMRGRLLYGLARRGYLGKLYYGNHVLALNNKLTCESHNEALQRLFMLLTKKYNM